MLTLVMHSMLKAMSGRDFALFLRAFLPVARHAWFNYAAVVGMIVSPILATIWLGSRIVWVRPSRRSTKRIR